MAEADVKTEKEETAATEAKTEENKEEKKEEVAKATEEKKEEDKPEDFKMGNEQAAESVLNIAKTFPGMADEEGVKNLMKTVEKVKGSEGGKKEESKVEDKKEEEKKEEDKPEDKKEEENKKEEKEETGVWGITTKTDAKKIETEDEFKDYVKKKYAIEDYNTLVASADKWRADSQKLVDVNTQYTNVVEGLASLPMPIKNAINAWSTAKDWEKAFSSTGSRLDFDAEVSEHSKDTLVKHYFPDKLEKLDKKLKGEEIEEDDYKERVEDLHDSSITLYKKDKENFESQRATLLKESEQVQTKFRDSAVSSVDVLKGRFPDFNPDELNGVQQGLVRNEINALFFDKDGLYLKDAAIKFALAKHGEPLLERIKEMAKREGESKATEEMVATGSDKMKTSKVKTSAKEKQEKDAVQHLGGVFGEDPYATVPTVGK
jgi:hypothetical protein